MFGPGSSDELFLKCLVKTRQWQDTLLLNQTDSRPCAAYYRTLGYMKAGLPQKAMEWVNECLQYEQLAVSKARVWSTLEQIQQHWQFPCEDGLYIWQDSFLVEPLHYQWMNSEEVLLAAGSYPFSCGHNCGSLMLQPVDTAYQQPPQGTADNAALMQQLFENMPTSSTEPHLLCSANPAADLTGLSHQGLPTLNVNDGNLSADQYAHQEHAVNMPAGLPAGVQPGPDVHAQPVLIPHVQPCAVDAGIGAQFREGALSIDNMVSNG